MEDEIGNISDVKEYSITESDFAYDETVDNNLRYIGKDPNNYVWFEETYKSDIYDLYNSNAKMYYGLSFKSVSECDALKSESWVNAAAVCIKTKDAGNKILWRIIGLMNNIDDGTGKKEARIKLIREDSNLGHKRIETTENYYIFSSIENLKNVTETFEKNFQILDDGIYFYKEKW